MIRCRQRWAILAMIVSFLLTTSAFGVTKGQWAALKKGDYHKIVREISKNSFKDGADWYVLGKAYYQIGKKQEALKAWKNAKQIADKFPKGTKKGVKYAHLFPPGATAKQKSAIFNDFKTKYKGLAAAMAVAKANEAKDHLYNSTKKTLDAKRKAAEAKKLQAHADAEYKAAEKKRQLNKDKGKSRNRRVRSTGAGRSVFIATCCIMLAVFACWCVWFVFFRSKEEEELPRSYNYEPSPHSSYKGTSSGRSSGTSSNRACPPRPSSSRPTPNRKRPRNVNRQRPRSRSGRGVPGTSFRNVGYDNSYFMSPFWYMGHYYLDSNHYYRTWGSHYTNSMYMNNYDSYGHGQGRDRALDDEIIDHINDGEHLEKMSADAVAESENFSIDAEEEKLEAEVAANEAEELEESMDFGDEATESDFEDAAPEENEFEDDAPVDDFANDAPEEDFEPESEPEDEWEEPEPEPEEFDEPDPEPEEEWDSGDDDDDF